MIANANYIKTLKYIKFYDSDTNLKNSIFGGKPGRNTEVDNLGGVVV